LERLVPEVIDDLDLVLAGTRGMNVETVKSSLTMLGIFRDSVLNFLDRCGTPVLKLEIWEPWHSQAV
jgi:hypothetical protein